MINYALIGETLLHPTQRAILKAFEDRDTTLSPNVLKNLLDEPLGKVSYHVAQLAGVREDSKFRECPLLKLADTQPRRGAVEHFYRLTPKARLS